MNARHDLAGLAFGTAQLQMAGPVVLTLALATP